MTGKLLLLAACLLLGAIQTGAADKKEPEETYVKVEIKGTLQTGIVAIGGETTGTVVKTKDATLELDLGKDAELREQAEKLSGKTVIVKGSLTMRKGIEVKQRTIVKVASLKAAATEEK